METETEKPQEINIPDENPSEEAHKDTEAQSFDEFSYLQRNEFTSEIYKIEVRNLGYFGIGEFKKLIKTKLQLDMTKIKSPKRKDFAFVCFRSEEQQKRAIELLNGYRWKGKELQAIIAKASADPLMKRRNMEQKDGNIKRVRTSADAICPLASLTYEEQLKHKHNEMDELLQKFLNKLKYTNSQFRQHSEAFEFKGVQPSPQTTGYRNKNEFTVGKNADGEIVVGFRLGSYADGSTEVSEVHNLPHIPETAKWAANSFQDFVRKSKFLPFKPETNSGHFRQVMVRTSTKTDEIMIVPGLYTSNLTEEELNELKMELKNFYESAQNEKGYKCTSLYYQDVKHRQAGQYVSPVEYISGTKFITDEIHNLKFQISPLAFFQINTEGANVLYQQAIDLAAPTPQTTVLDICCGTGTIALAFAKHCKQVLGVEIIEDAIRDAETNAKNNGIGNCKFYVGNADDYIQSMVREVVYGNAPGDKLDLVAVVDPPRAGLHNRSIAALRAASTINRIVYISCNPMHAQKNWIELGRPQSKQYKSNPFFPKTAIAVDMFPHTTHTELIILFERVKGEEVTESKSEIDSSEKTENKQTESVDAAVSDVSNAAPTTINIDKADAIEDTAVSNVSNAAPSTINIDKADAIENTVEENKVEEKSMLVE
ncbi:tRNA (uracil-5-)-methyltransferase homolog A [Teleopsis dalmanni]|uniref:tRNA (uracil-5-)-methyltransferase homolog A-like n=1 Tax=Teleopsis dalmanni TaxID=139649 RepID=UPI0018CD1EC8|nr:tRNA (uracil-5-)-methyltransferase homolog A-like [Teleopsis dalmanni]XP_037938474.1 tRNA (uracil-5-)-methyltransferase homolog A [Teleopsis dalmanni]